MLRTTKRMLCLLCRGAGSLAVAGACVAACGKAPGESPFESGPMGSSSPSIGGSSAITPVPSGSGGNTLVLSDASASGGAGTSSGGATVPSPTPAMGSVMAADCPACTFPASSAPSCAQGTAPIQVVYPPDTVLVPPNMNEISVQWTPYGSTFSKFEVDFKSANTDWRIVSRCAVQTNDSAQPPTPSGGCELIVDPASWAALAAANRGGDPVSVTVRGTTDGTCASSSNTVHMSFAEEDLLGTLYYWKSTATSNGTGGDIWAKTFGDSSPEALVTQALNATCNGCHTLARDGSKMVVYSDDDDSDDSYSDVTGKLLDMTTTPASIIAGGTGKDTGQPPGFSALGPLATTYVTSNGTPDTQMAAANAFTLWNAQTGAFVGPVMAAGAGQRPTMPDWSSDGKSLIYVVPSANANWNGETDDAHIFGGSLYTMPYQGNGAFGAPAVFLQSKGENNYYPSYSPENSLVLFDRAALDMSAGAIDGCTGTAPPATCPNDSYSNPNARLMLTSSAAGQPVVDLETANGSPASSAVPASNSWPRWTPFVQSNRGSKLLWITFSSTRDYGVRVRNHKAGMFQCYPPDTPEWPNGDHGQLFDPRCQQPQLWMAPLNLTEAFNGQADPSGVAFWLPFQDITTHNHTPQWTQQAGSKTPPAPATCIAQGAQCMASASCCSPLTCQGGTCGQVLQ